MPLTIDDEEVDRLARALAARTGETVAEAVAKALKDRLFRERARVAGMLSDEIMAISERAARLPRRTGRSADEIVGYDERGLPT